MKSEFIGQIVEIDKRGVVAYTNVPDTSVNDNGICIWCVPKDNFAADKMKSLITHKEQIVHFIGDCMLSVMDEGVTDTNLTFTVDDIKVE